MHTSNSRNIPTIELAEEILEELDDLYQDQAISAPIYRKKRGYSKVIKAINNADRVTVRDMNLTAMVVLFVPQDQASIPFANNYRYYQKYQDSINADTDLSSENKKFFLGKDAFLDVVEIKSTYLYVFDSYPVSAERSESRIKRVNHSEFYGREERLRYLQSTYFPTQYYEDRKDIESLCYFIPDEQRLVLDAKFSSDTFLQFEGRIMPGLITFASLSDQDKANEDWARYTIKAPHWAYETLKYEALLYLLPMSSQAYKIIEERKARVKRDMEASKPSDSTILTPPHSY